MTAHTGTASTVHEPFGKPGGPGLWHHKGLQLPPYIQHVAHHLVASGHDESKAIEMAVGIVKNWAEGHDGRGNRVHPDVQAAAAKNIAQWEADKAKAGRSAVTTTQRAEMASASINDLPDSDFAYIEPGGSKDSTGRTVPREKRHFPVHDAAHVRDALSRAPQSPFGDKAMPKIRQAAKRFGVDVADDSGSGRAESLGTYYRDFPLADLSVRSGGRDGRIVTAYAAVFNTPTEIHDQDGDYYEVIDPAAFNRAISDARPQGGRKGWKVGVFYNHGRTLAGTPSDRHSMPIGVPISITADNVGVLTETQYHRSDFCEEIVEGLESGAIPGYSFSGMFRRSQPLIPRGGFRRDRAGSMQTVRRTESTLREYGPTPFPAYADAAIVGMRAETILAAMASDPELAQRMVSMFRDGAPLDSPPPSGAPAPGLAAEDSRPRVRSGRSIREELQAARSAFLQRHRR